MPEPYAVRMNQDGTRTKYRNRTEYERGRMQASATAAAQRSSINRRLRANVV